VNETKSSVARPQERKFLGFSITNGPQVKRAIAPKALERFSKRVREITRRAKDVSIEATMAELVPYLQGWRGYFGFRETPEVLIGLIRWVRLRLRAALWRQSKAPRLASNTAAAVLAPGISREPKPCLLGFPMPTSNRLVFPHSSTSESVTSRTAVYGPVRTVV
jgi:RNA-directed DNA polymerase